MSGLRSASATANFGPAGVLIRPFGLALKNMLKAYSGTMTGEIRSIGLCENDSQSFFLLTGEKNVTFLCFSRILL
jgi:hypothetical protein